MKFKRVVTRCFKIGQTSIVSSHQTSSDLFIQCLEPKDQLPNQAVRFATVLNVRVTEPYRLEEHCTRLLAECNEIYDPLRSEMADFIPFDNT